MGRKGARQSGDEGCQEKWGMKVARISGRKGARNSGQEGYKEKGRKGAR